MAEFNTGDDLSRTNLPGDRRIAHLTIRLCRNTSKQTDYPSRQTIGVFRLNGRTSVDILLDRIYRINGS